MVIQTRVMHNIVDDGNNACLYFFEMKVCFVKHGCIEY